MFVATSSFGPSDITTIQEIVEQLDNYEGGDAIYVKDGELLRPSTPAAVSSSYISGAELCRELGFRYLADMDLAQEAIHDFGPFSNPAGLQQLLELIEEYGF